MTTQQAERLARLTSQLAEKLMTAILCADEIRSTITTEFSPAKENGRPTNSTANPRPLLDESTFSVLWRGMRLKIGHNRCFWLLRRLAQSPNQYVSHLDLLNDVWDSEELTTATIRSVARHLRRRLCDGGMRDLAGAIRGHNGHYVMDL